MRLLTALLVACLVATALSGCTGTSRSIELTLKGAGISGNEGHAACRTSGNLTASVDLTAGVGGVIVLDGNGTEVLKKVLRNKETYAGDVMGANGTWTLRISRSEGSNGTVTAKLRC